MDCLENCIPQIFIYFSFSDWESVWVMIYYCAAKQIHSSNTPDQKSFPPETGDWACLTRRGAINISIHMDILHTIFNQIKTIFWLQLEL